MKVQHNKDLNTNHITDSSAWQMLYTINLCVYYQIYAIMLIFHLISPFLWILLDIYITSVENAHVIYAMRTKNINPYSLLKSFMSNL